MSRLLHQLLHDAADAFPGHGAVVDGDREISYRQLDTMASRIAHQLRSLNVRRGDRVGLYLEKSAESIACLYGVLKVGAAYVPLPVDAPAARLAHMIRHARIRVLLTSAERARRWSALTGHDSPVEYLVCVDGPVHGRRESPGATVIDSSSLAQQPESRPAVTVDADDLAYILYTSGSTGVPKGVMLSHRNALSFVGWAARQFDLTHEDRLSGHAPLNFDLSVFDVFASAYAGASLVLVPKVVAAFSAELARFVQARDISVWYSVPSAVNVLAARARLGSEGLPRLRLVLFAGEVFPVSQLRRALDAFPDAEFCNLFGPTETNVCTFHRVVRPIEPDTMSIPIGLPIDGVELLCLTDDGRVADTNERGELWVHGPTVMRGYLGEPEQTARILRAPDPARPELVAYRTGDLVTQDKAGCWHFLGRRDAQIKSRGYRIELGEVEAALSGHPAVAECAVVPVPDARFGNQIKAYVVVKEPVSPPALTRYVRGILPSYMVPWSFEVVRALPRTATGKVNYQALKATDGRT